MKEPKNGSEKKKSPIQKQKEEKEITFRHLDIFAIMLCLQTSEVGKRKSRINSLRMHVKEFLIKKLLSAIIMELKGRGKNSTATQIYKTFATFISLNQDKLTSIHLYML